MGVTKTDKWEIRGCVGTEAGNTFRHGDVHLSFRMPGYSQVNEHVVTDILNVEGAHNILSQSKLMDQGPRIVPVNGYLIQIYDNQDEASIIDGAHQIGDPLRFDLDLPRKGHQWKDSARDM